MIALIAAAAGKKLVIGKNGDLPWHFASDLKFFKETTLGHTVLMGRVTYDSILKRLGKPLPGRRTVVLTRDKRFQDPRVDAIHSLDGLKAKTGEQLFIIGGDKVFQQTMNIAGRIYLTYIDKEIAGDAFFPALDEKRWKLVAENKISENGTQLYFRTYDVFKSGT